MKMTLTMTMTMTMNDNFKTRKDKQSFTCDLLVRRMLNTFFRLQCKLQNK
jgi:hypothetical protein